MTIKTNNQPRDLLCFWDLSNAEQQSARSNFDWLDDLEENCGFFRYRGQLENLGDFLRGGPEGWDGARSDSYFSGTLVRLSEDGESVTVGRWLS